MPADRVYPLASGMSTYNGGNPYGRRSDGYALGYHTGADFGVPTGTPVLSAQPGKVVSVANQGGQGYGLHVVVQHASVATVYAHLSQVAVRQGQVVEMGQVLGKSGYSGNVRPAGPGGAHLHFEVRTSAGSQASALDPIGWLRGADAVAGVPGTGATDITYDPSGGPEEKREPLPKLPDFKAGSGRSRPGLGDDTFRLNGKPLDADISGLVTAVTLDLAVGQVGELALICHDPTLNLARRDLSGAILEWDRAKWDLSADSVSLAAAEVTLAARSRLARRLRSTFRVVGTHKRRPDQWVVQVIDRLGGKAIVEPASGRGVLPEGTDQTLWDVLSGLADDLGWALVEHGGYVWFGSPAWALAGGTGLPMFPVTWRSDERTDLLDATVSKTADDPDNTGVGDLTLPWAAGSRLRPWHRLELSGLGKYDGVWLVETVSAANDGTSMVTVGVTQPRARAATSTGNPSLGGNPPRDKQSPAYAQWYARRFMVKKYGWGDDQWEALRQLWTRESGWRWNADNPTSDAYGIPQALPGSKMASAGADWRTNPETQVRWGLSYIKGRYGTPARAWAHFQANNWY